MLFRAAVLILALGPLVYYLMTLGISVLYFRGRNRATGRSTYNPPVSILKPVRGLDREAYENFVSFCEQDYPEYEILFCVSNLSDPAVVAIQRLQSRFPERKIRLLIGAAPVGTSDKLNKLCRLAKEASYEVLVISDADIRVEQRYLRGVVAPFADSKVGAVTVLFRSLLGSGFGSRLDAAGAAVEFASSALLSRKLEGLHFTLGFTMATTKERLAEIGGFEAFASHAVDDYELGRRITEKGYRIELAETTVTMVHPCEDLLRFLRHELRWTIGLRSVRRGGHAAMGLTFGLPWTMLAIAAAPSGGFRVAYLLTYLGLRYAVYLCVGVWGLQDAAVQRNWWLAPVRDLADVGVWVASFFTNRICWRGTDFRVENGQLVPLDQAPRRAVHSRKPELEIESEFDFRQPLRPLPVGRANLAISVAAKGGGGLDR